MSMDGWDRRHVAKALDELHSALTDLTSQVACLMEGEGTMQRRNEILAPVKVALSEARAAIKLVRGNS